MSDLRKFAQEILHEGVADIDPDMWNRVMNTTADMKKSIAPCVKCSAEDFSIHYSSPMRDNLIISGMCFQCHFWQEMKEAFEGGFSRNGDRRQVIVDGQHYTYDTIEPIKDKTIGGFLGHGGREWHIKFPDRDTFIVTNDLWCQGTIPELWLPDFPNNATFVPTPSPYAKLHKEFKQIEERNND